jgi:hypothetical protein
MRSDLAFRYPTGERLGQRAENALKPWVKVLLVTVLVTIAAMVLGPIIWPIAEGAPSPPRAS